MEHYKQCFKHKLNHEGLCPACEREVMDGFKTMNEVIHSETFKNSDDAIARLEEIKKKHDGDLEFIEEIDCIIDMLKMW